MRTSHVATALAAFLAGSTAATVLHRCAVRPAPVATPLSAARVDEPDAVLLPFPRRVIEQAAATAPARCGDSGGLTKAGAPCGARATAGGRCHHHPLAA